MKATAKYLFDEDFSGDKPTITMVEHERRRADAESQAYRTGFAAAQAQAHADAEQRIAMALGRLADGLERVDRGLATIEARLEAEAVEVAIAVAAKLAPALIANEPFAEIAALATECFRHLVTTPHMVVRIGEDIYEAGKAKLDEIAQARGFEGRLVVMAEPALAAGDCRIEWADGGVNRDRTAIKNAIGDVVGRYMAARTAH
jgi:flagellar assembly protein FliH